MGLGTVPTKKSAPALKGDVRLENQPAGENTDSQIARSCANLALTHLRSRAILTSDAALRFPARLSLCKLTVQTGKPKHSRIRKLSSISVML